MIGIDAAASGGFSFEGSEQGYAIPINRALKIAGQIEAGRRSSTVHVGPTAFLGIALSRAGDGDEDVAGALVEDVVSHARRPGGHRRGRPHHVVRREASRFGRKPQEARPSSLAGAERPRHVDRALRTEESAAVR